MNLQDKLLHQEFAPGICTFEACSKHEIVLADRNKQLVLFDTWYIVWPIWNVTTIIALLVSTPWQARSNYYFIENLKECQMLLLVPHCYAMRHLIRTFDLHQSTYGTSYKKVTVVWLYNSYGYSQSPDTRTDVVDVTYEYNTSCTDMTFGRFYR